MRFFGSGQYARAWLFRERSRRLTGRPTGSRACGNPEGRRDHHRHPLVSFHPAGHVPANEPNRSKAAIDREVLVFVFVGLGVCVSDGGDGKTSVPATSYGPSYQLPGGK